RCRLSLGGKQLISSPFCSASDSPPPSTETFNRPQHTKFLTRPRMEGRRLPAERAPPLADAGLDIASSGFGGLLCLESL
ncbi:hypothetical protein NX907_28280, partial [Burkholderia thailandensis]|uniref:hypothetical protein n=1 Tax=Burkholderia thailandensis TaxID=57975 RepID=UPI00217E79A5